MPKKCCRARAMQQNNTSFAEALAAICRGNFMVVTCINLLLMTDYYLIFVTGTAHVQKTFGASLSVAGLSSGIMVIGCFVGRFVTGNQMSALGGRPCLLAGLLLGLAVAWNIDVIVPAIERLLHTSFLPQDIYLISHMPSDPQAADIVPIALISLVLAFVATVYPSWRASRVNPAQALRYE